MQGISDRNLTDASGAKVREMVGDSMDVKTAVTLLRAILSCVSGFRRSESESQVQGNDESTVPVKACRPP